MEIDPVHLKELYSMLADKTGQQLDFKGFNEMSILLGNGVTQKYLYENYNRLKKAPAADCIKLQDAKINSLLNFLGFKNWEEFIHFLQNPIDEVLKNCEGSWISYVRQNSSEGILFKSPVEIFEENKRMFYRLKGPHSVFVGELTYNNGCLFTHFKAENGKQFHHIYKIGNRIEPKLMQGVFSGISTAGDPIGGRTILLRSEVQFEMISNEKIAVKDLKDSEDPFEKNLSVYMESFEKNNLRLNKVVSFDVEDLL